MSIFISQILRTNSRLRIGALVNNRVRPGLDRLQARTRRNSSSLESERPELQSVEQTQIRREQREYRRGSDAVGRIQATVGTLVPER